MRGDKIYEVRPIYSKYDTTAGSTLKKISEFISTDNKQFGFKKGMGCSHAIYTVRHVVERFIKGGNTVNLCMQST